MVVIRLILTNINTTQGYSNKVKKIPVVFFYPEVGLGLTLHLWFAGEMLYENTKTLKNNRKILVGGLPNVERGLIGIVT